jgi:hypothetical protein
MIDKVIPIDYSASRELAVENLTLLVLTPKDSLRGGCWSSNRIAVGVR